MPLSEDPLIARPAPAPSPAWALVKRIVTDVRQNPSDDSPRLSQALLGEAALVLAETGAWAQVQLDRDNCVGWVHARALHRCLQAEAVAYQQACNALVSTELLPAFHYLTPTRSSGGGLVATGEAGKLPFGLTLPVVAQQELWAAVQLPDGAQWWVSNILLPLTSRPRPDTPGLTFALDMLRRCVGVPYLPGGRTPFGFDEAGLAQALWGLLDVRLPRHVLQQFEAGQPVETEPQPGDLIFFGESDREAHRSVTHVGLSLGGDELIPANRHTWSVAIHSLDARSPRYHAWLCDHLVGVRRFG